MGASLAEVARACEVNPNVLHGAGGGNFRTMEITKRFQNGQRPARAEESQVSELERKVKVGAGAGDRFFCVVACSMFEEQRKLQALDSRQLVYPYLEKEMSLATPIPAGTAACRLGLVSRAGFYRWKLDTPTTTDVRTSICATRFSADRAGVSLLWLAAHHRRTGEARLPGQPHKRV